MLRRIDTCIKVNFEPYLSFFGNILHMIFAIFFPILWPFFMLIDLFWHAVTLYQLVDQIVNDKPDWQKVRGQVSWLDKAFQWPVNVRKR